MTLDPDLHRLLNEQVRNEMASSHNYLAMSAWFEQTPEELQDRFPAWYDQQQYYLAISGGGAGGGACRALRLARPAPLIG